LNTGDTEEHRVDELIYLVFLFVPFLLRTEKTPIAGIGVNVSIARAN
jgi:hypothetical protein